MYKYLISLFAICFLLTGCGLHGEMRYTAGFGQYVDKRFAKRIAKCERYYSPAFYYGRGVFQMRRHTINIKGWDGNSCKIVVDDRGFLPPDDDKPQTLLVPKRFTKDISEILLLAFKEPEYKEEKAVEKALNFCQEHRISGCLIQYSVDKRPILYYYLAEIASFFEDYDPKKEVIYDGLNTKGAQEKAICDGMIEDAKTMLRQTSSGSFENIPNKEMGKYICSRIKNAKMCNYHSKNRVVYVSRETEYKGSSFTKCRFDVKLNNKSVTDTYFWSANPYNIINRTGYYQP